MLKACKVDNLVKKIKVGDVEQELLKGMDLSIDKGEFTVIVGPSGAGKSTLLNILGGLDRVTGGTVESAGFDLSKCDSKKMNQYRQKIGFVFQDYALIENLTVAENIELMSVITKKKVDTKEILKKVDLEKHADKFPGQLSGGEKQRVSIARALAKNPEILFCDEPTGALDEKNGKKVLQILQNLNKAGTTVVVVTHLLGMQKMANHIIRVVDGKIKDDILNDDVIAAEDVVWA
ncbi:ABC transporter ATP-binding protein [Butyrivibrio sp. YAB3001]|uniref:ABC transporter ATP-binding protein n=1 Tax=Butyrivibrio sp. YAB3001 TaxID=1520812 RepID=UPI0008F62F54|nr:ABC transporter ATP-binding protein [Butyrivibrio sp. YAB3001]SFC13041.1 putative ABC transport system ATP-binding protein [Butyrivibrio sp. YAB3001]